MCNCLRALEQPVFRLRKTQFPHEILSVKQDADPDYVNAFRHFIYLQIRDGVSASCYAFE